MNDKTMLRAVGRNLRKGHSSVTKIERIRNLMLMQQKMPAGTYQTRTDALRSIGGDVFFSTSYQLSF